HGLGASIREELFGDGCPRPWPRSLDDAEVEAQVTGNTAERASVAHCLQQCIAAIALVLGQAADDVGHLPECRLAGLGYDQPTFLGVNESQLERLMNWDFELYRKVKRVLRPAPVQRDRLDETQDLLRSQSGCRS